MPSTIILTITQGEQKGRQFRFDCRTICIIGRHKDCNIQIPKNQTSISRYHCLLDINPPDIRVRDFGSRNGTFVNGKCIGKRSKEQTPSEGKELDLSEYDLKDGDEIKLENIVFKVSIESDVEVPSTFKEGELFKVPPPVPVGDKDNLISFPGYETISRLGKGGFGEVYLARRNITGSKELVAIKTLLPQVMAKPYMRERFMREVMTTKVLDHPNLVKLINFDTADKMFFLAMEYCDRGSVSDLIKVRQGKLAIKEVIDIILQVLDGLHYAHTEKGLVHRDIKPGNIFLTVKDNKLVAKLGDYGLAKNFDLAGLSGQTLTGTKIGTPVFMSRQQALDFKYAKPDVDVWAVAATLYYMLTRKYPRDFAGIEPMLAILQTQPTPIRDRDPSIPKPLADLIDLALRDDRELHFKNAISFKQALLGV